MIWFPRALADERTHDRDTYHVFCDASQQAYCCVVYLVVGGESRLVMANSRLALLNPNLTIPRMELMAALIGARLMAFIREALQLHEPQVVSWTEWTGSTDVLYRIRNRRSRKVFVENRVAAIRELTNSERWNHVRGVGNPADLGTRGISMAALKESNMWWKGPPFLLTWQTHGKESDAEIR